MDTELRLSGLSADDFGSSEETAFKESVASSLSLIASEDNVQNVNATDVVVRRRLFGSTSLVDVSYTLLSAMETNGYSTPLSLFAALATQLTEAVYTGLIEVYLQSTDVFFNVSVINGSYTE